MVSAQLGVGQCASSRKESALLSPKATSEMKLTQQEMNTEQFLLKDSKIVS